MKLKVYSQLQSLSAMVKKYLLKNETFRHEYELNLNMMMSKYEMLVKRITIIIDDDIDKKLRQYQSKMIQQNVESYSYSRTINDILRKGLK